MLADAVRIGPDFDSVHTPCYSKPSPFSGTLLDGADGQGVLEYVAGVPAGLDLLEPGVIVLVVQRVPGNPGGVPLRISKVHVGVVDEGAVADLAGHGHATGVREEVPVERANPGQAPRFVLWLCPASRARHGENRFPLG